MGLFDAPLDGFLPEDFDVYLPDCWSSNLHNLQRMKTKGKLVKLAQNAQDVFKVAGLGLSSSSEIPSVWNGRQVRDQIAYFSRDSAHQKRLQTVIAREFDLAERIKAGAEHERHLILFTRIDAEAITLGLRFTRYSLIDNRNLLARLTAETEYFETLLSRVNEAMNFENGGLTHEGLSAALHELGEGSRDSVELSRSWKREAIIDLGQSVEETLKTCVGPCAELFEAALWTEENDHLRLVDTLAELTQQVSESLERTSQRREAKAEEHAQRAAQARERTGAKVEAEAAWRKMQRDKRASTEPERPVRSDAGTSSKAKTEARRPSRSKPPESKVSRTRSDKRSTKAQTEKTSKRNTKSKRPRKEPKKAWGIGDECMLTRGLFMGKRGQVVEAPQNGYVKVKVGVIEVSVSVLELDL